MHASESPDGWWPSSCVGSLGGAAACSDDDDDGGDATDDDDAPTDGGGSTELAVDDADLEAVATTYADLVFAAYDDAITGGRPTLQTAIDGFVAAPTDATLEAAKQAWLAARDVYGPTEAFRFYDGPIDNPDDGPEGQINAWPLDEAYIDYVEGDPTPASSTTPRASPRSPTDVSSRPTRRAARPTSPPAGTPSSSCSGARTSATTAPAPARSPTTPRRPTAERRADLPRRCSPTCWSTTSRGVRDQWDPEGGAYREEFLADPDQAVVEHPPRHGRAVRRRAGRRAHRRRLRDQGPGGRALLLLRQHHRRRRSATPAASAWSTLADYDGRRRHQSLSDVVAEVDPDLDAALREQLDANVAAGRGPRGAVRPADPGRRRRAGPRAAARADRRASRTRATPSPRWPAPRLPDQPGDLSRPALRRPRRPRSWRLAVVALLGRAVQRRRRDDGDAADAAPPDRRRAGRARAATPPSRSRGRRRSPSPCPASSGDDQRDVRGRQQLLQRQLGDRARSTEGRDGLGPLFNAQSCSSCHFQDGRAQPPDGRRRSRARPAPPPQRARRRPTRRRSPTRSTATSSRTGRSTACPAEGIVVITTDRAAGHLRRRHAVHAGRAHLRRASTPTDGRSSATT